MRIVVGGLESNGKHLYAIVQVYLGDALVFADRLALDRARDRHQFAAEVKRLAEDADPAAVERELLKVLDTAAAEAGGSPEGGISGLMQALSGTKQADQLLQLADPGEYFHSPDQEPYATVPVDGHRETWQLDARGFKDWLASRYYAKAGSAPSANTIRDALGVLRARALFDGPERAVHVRTAGLGGGLYLDLGDDEWRAVEILPGAWRVVSDPPVRFRRPRGLLALPVPQAGGSLDGLRRFVNVQSGDWRLLLSWLVMAVRDRGPYPILMLYGQQGAAKSTTARILRGLLDPNAAPVRAKPRDEVDLLIAARGGSVVALDNVSHLSDELCDALCRLATGGGIGRRQLFTDSDETLLDAMRPTIVNGIEALGRRGDLADRSLVLELPPISGGQRRDERRFWRDFEAARPALLGALLDVVAAALAAEPDVHLADLPRMADFAVWAAAAAPSLGWTPAAFLEAYANNRQDQDHAVLDDSPLTRFLVDLVEEHDVWSGTFSELLAELRDRADDRALKDRRWPKDATRLSGALRRLTPSLHAARVGVEPFREPDRERARKVRLWRIRSDEPDPDSVRNSKSEADSASAASAASEAANDQIGNQSTGADAAARSQRPPACAPASTQRPVSPADATADARRTLENEASVRSSPDSADAADALDAELQPHSEVYAEVITGAEAAARAVAEILRFPVAGLDIETTGLDPRSHRIRLVQLAAPDGRVYVFDAFALDARVLLPLFDPTNGPVLIGHNLAFDLGFLAEAGLPLPNGGRLFDTMLAAHVLEDGASHFPTGHFTLAAVAARYLRVTIDKALQASNWSGLLSGMQIQYAARDAAVLPKLHAVLAERIAANDLDRVTRLEMRALPGMVWLARTGAPFDADAWIGLAEQAARRQVELEQALADMAGTLDMLGGSTVNWASPDQVKRVLTERGHTVERVDEAALAGLVDVEPLARLLLDYREASKRVGTYGLKFLEHVHPATGRIHADWHQLGSRAGRMSCSKPNLQQVPRDRAYRACFRPIEGRALVKADFSQIELRIAAEIANDERLIAAYAAGEDVHALTAAEVLGRRNGSVTKEDRQAAKALNFGLIYGAGGPTLRATAKTSYGVELSEADSMRFRRKFFELYPGLRAWHRSQPGDERPVDTRSLAGRRRLGVTRFTEKLNTPIQASGADGFKAAIALLWETRHRCPRAAPVLVVHDEIVIECDEADVAQTREWLVDCMTRGMGAFLTRVPVVVEATAESDWSGTPLGDGPNDTVVLGR